MSPDEKAAELRRLEKEGYPTHSKWFDDLRPEDEPPWPHWGSEVY